VKDQIINDISPGVCRSWANHVQLGGYESSVGLVPINALLLTNIASTPQCRLIGSYCWLAQGRMVGYSLKWTGPPMGSDCTRSVHESYVFNSLGLAFERKQVPRFVGKVSS